MHFNNAAAKEQDLCGGVAFTQFAGNFTHFGDFV
jgi:hypothetical protein